MFFAHTNLAGYPGSLPPAMLLSVEVIRVETCNHSIGLECSIALQGTGNRCLVVLTKMPYFLLAFFFRYWYLLRIIGD
jgi:hypothetical protein